MSSPTTCNTKAWQVGRGRGGTKWFKECLKIDLRGTRWKAQMWTLNSGIGGGCVMNAACRYAVLDTLDGVVGLELSI